MKTLHIITKSLREQLRHYWMLLLNLSMGPFFIFVYYLIISSSQPTYTIEVVNNDAGISGNRNINYGAALSSYLENSASDTSIVPFVVNTGTDRSSGISHIQDKKADILLVIPDSFSYSLQQRKSGIPNIVPNVEFIGDLTQSKYLISAVLANELINRFTLQETKSQPTLEVRETALGTSASITDFDMIVPGILIISIIMLMFTASIAFVSEVEHKTILRLKLSKLTALEFLGGISFVQLLVGIASVLLTLLTALMLGFQFQGSLGIMVLIAVLTSLSIIAFSLIIAAATKSANEVLVVGNIPMFLFMFFTGAAFPLKSEALFTIAGYPVSIQGLLSPSHAISALNKTLVMDMPVGDILPELVSILILTIIYFFIGAAIFKKRHLKLT